MQQTSYLLSGLLNLIYPPLCMHCSSVKEDSTGLFCSGCITFLEAIDPTHRCIYCFSSNLNPLGKVCLDCRSETPYYQRVASVFDYEGPPATLIKKMKHGAKPYLAQGAGAWMAVQFFKLGWPMPDIITSPPMTWLKKIDRGYNQSALIGEALSKYLGRPYRNLLDRSLGGYSQAALNKEQRKVMGTNPYCLKPRTEITDFRILVVDDVLTTGATLKRCAEALYAGNPSTLYAMTFCRA